MGMIIDKTKIDSDAKKLAEVLLSCEVGASIAIYQTRSPELIASMQAVLRSGHPYIPLDPEHPHERITSILEEAQPGLILTQKHLMDRLPPHFNKIDVEELFDTNGKGGGKAAVKTINPEDPAYIIFTSGSTGKPKGVMIPHRAMNNFLDSMAKKPGLIAEDRLLAVTTVSFDISVLELFLPLRVGAQIVLLDKDDSRDPEAIIEALVLHDITVMQATPATWKMMVDAGWKGKKNLKILCGGEALSPELAKALLDRCGELWNMYGPTETTVWSTVERVERNRPISIGKPIDNTYIYILDEKLKPLSQGVVGDLYIGGHGLALGYYNRPDLTENVFIPSPFKPGEKIYKTGDLARNMEDGRLECLGRSDFQVKIRGFRIELGEIESTLMKWNDIKNVVVHPQVLRNGMKELVAYFIAGKEIKSSDLVTFLAMTLTDYMIPSFFIRMEEFPLNPNGKIDRNALPKPYIQNDIVPKNLTSFSLIDKILFTWKKVLKRQDILPDQNFFELGGNSILAVQALRELKILCGISLPLSTFFKYPVITELVSKITSGDDKEETVLLLNKGNGGTPLFCLGGIDLYAELAGRLNNRPVYGVFLPYEEQLIDHIQRDTLDEWEYMTIQGMATAYLREIRKHYPQGPCHFLGVSIAGMIAFEASRIIWEQEGERGALFILDSHLPHARTLSFMGKMVSLLKRVKNKKPHSKTDKEGSVLDPEYVAAIRDSINDKAIDQFDNDAQPIGGDAFLIKALKNTYARGESYKHDLGWSDLVTGRIDICELSDDHLGILKNPHVNKLADFLCQRL